MYALTNCLFFLEEVLEMDFLNTKQVSELLGVEPITLAIWRHRNRGPSYVKIGGNVRYYRKDIDAYLKRGTVKPSKR